MNEWRRMRKEEIGGASVAGYEGAGRLVQQQRRPPFSDGCEQTSSSGERCGHADGGNMQKVLACPEPPSQLHGKDWGSRRNFDGTFQASFRHSACVLAFGRGTDDHKPDAKSFLPLD